MFRRIGIFVVLFCAFVLFQAHNMIPHHHDDDEKGALHHDHNSPFHSDSHKHHHSNKNAHSDIPYLKHSAEFGNGIIKTEVVSVSDAKVFLVIDADLPAPVELVISPKYSPPDCRYELRHYTYLSTRLFSCRSLRAPPVVA